MTFKKSGNPIAAAVIAEIRATRQRSVRPCQLVVQSAAVLRCREWRRLSSVRSPTISCHRFCTSQPHTTCNDNTSTPCYVIEVVKHWLRGLTRFCCFYCSRIVLAVATVSPLRRDRRRCQVLPNAVGSSNSSNTSSHQWRRGMKAGFGLSERCRKIFFSSKKFRPKTHNLG